MLHEQLQKLHRRLDHIPLLLIRRPLGIHEQLVLADKGVERLTCTVVNCENCSVEFVFH